MEIKKNFEYRVFPEILSQYQTALQKLDTLGVKVPSNSRLKVYEKRLKSAVDDPSPKLPGDFVGKLMFDLKEIDEIILICRDLPAQPNKVELSKLKWLVSGTEDVDKEINAQSRNTQYELLLRHIFSQASIAARLEEPDLVITMNSRNYPLAAKRPRTENGFDDCLRKAVSQIPSPGPAGVIAISLDSVIRPKETYLSVPNEDALPLAPNNHIRAFVKRFGHSIANRVRRRNVGVLLFTFRIPGRIESSMKVSLASGVHLEPLLQVGHDDFPMLGVLEGACAQFI